MRLFIAIEIPDEIKKEMVKVQEQLRKANIDASWPRAEGMHLTLKYLGEVPVSYPLLTVNGDVPHLYRDIARYPAIFLIDRQGRLQPAPSPDQPFEKVEAAVEALLKSGSQ